MKTTAKVPSIIAAAASALAAACFGADVTDQIQYFANPAKHYYSKSDITNMSARCCRRIKAIDGRLYIGLGDYTYNTGPTPVVALSPQTGAFTNEYSAGTEAIDDFKVFSNGKVYVPSLDPREASSSILGHFFIRSSTGDNGTWSLYKKIPAGVVHNTRSDTYLYTHCWDLAEFDGKIHFAGYGTASATLSGNSMGTFSDTCPTFDIGEMQIVLERFATGKWQYKTRNSTDLCRLYSFLEVDGVLYAMQNNKFAPGHDGTPVTSWDNVTYNTADTYLWRYSSATGQFSRETNTWDRILPSTGFDDALFTDTSYSRPVSTPVIVERTLKTFTGKSYYIATMRYRPLGVYRATISSADGKLSSQKIDLGANTWPADIIEADGKVRILAFSFDSTSTTNIVNKVFESTDGVSFSESYSFNHRQMAAAFEYLDNTYYFGFGMGSGSGYTHPAATNHVVSTEHNGEIWKLSTSSQPDDPPAPCPLKLVAPADGAEYDTIPWQVRTFLDNPELRSEYPDDDIIAAQDTDGNHYVLNAWMTNLLAQASAAGSGSPFKWSCEGGTLCDIAVEYSEDESFTSPIVERYASDGAIATRPRFLKTGTAYWWRVRGTLNGEAVVSDVRRFTTRVDAPRLIGVPAFNCRDFGGGTNADGIVVRQGLVIRGKCPPARVNAEIGENKKVATTEYYREFFINKLGIKTDLDFRSVSEAQEHQQKYGEIETSEIGINHVFYPITPYHLSLAANREPIRDMFRMLAEGTNYPVYCHCAVGSDRTGTFGVLLDGLLGRSDEHIYNNYELPSFDPGLARLRYCRKGSEMFASLEPRQDGHHMRDVVVDYLLRLGLTRDELKAIRRAFLVFDGPDDYIDNFTSPKAVYDSAARRLTFYCDSDDHTGDGLTAYKTSDGNASWYGKVATNAFEVVFAPSFASFRPSTCKQWFQDMGALTNISGWANLDTSEVRSFQNMFRGCKKLPSVDLSHFDTRKATVMQQMFYDCVLFKKLDLSSFKTPVLSNSNMMFYNCSAMTTIYVGWGFSVAKVKGSNGDNMFRKAKKLKGGCGTACDGSSNIGAAYAHIDTAGNPGYFTLAPGAEPLDPACVPLPAFSGDGAAAPHMDGQGRFVVAVGNAVAGGRYRLYATTSLSEPFEPVGEAVTAMADGVLEFMVDANGSPSLFVKVVAE